MRIIEEVCLTPPASGGNTTDWNLALEEVRASIKETVWPPGAADFAIYPESGKRSGEGNGVTPIKLGFLDALDKRGWGTKDRQNPNRMDAVRHFPDGWIGMEWETGNISSSHRSLNRFLLANRDGGMLGGILVLPTKELAQYLTDRVGNFEELQPYFPIFVGQDGQWPRGGIAVIAVQHDRTDLSVPRIAKGTDGRARR